MIAFEDRVKLQDLIAAYSWALDTGDAEALVACFTETCELVEEVFEEPDYWRGHAGIRGLAAHYFNAPGFPGRQHHVTQSQFTELESGRVNIRSFAFVTECHGEPPYLLRFAGWYEDIVVKVGERWLFERRAIRLWDGAVLEKFPGHGDWKPRKRPDSLVIKNNQNQGEL